MAMKTLPSYVYKVEFQEPTSTIVLFGNTFADREASMALLADNDLRPLTPRESLVNISQDHRLLDNVAGNWFYIMDNENGHKLSGEFFFNKKGKLTHGKQKDAERNVYAWVGEKPPLLIVNYKEDTAEAERRFTLDWNSDPLIPARMAVGIMPRRSITLPNNGLTIATIQDMQNQRALKKVFRS